MQDNSNKVTAAQATLTQQAMHL